MPAKKKNPNGRPPIFKTEKELETLIAAYWKDCEKRKVPITMSGLAFFIGVDRTTVINYGNREKFFNTIKRARQRVQADMEERLQGAKGSAAGIIFSFKNNFAWVDKLTHGLTGQDGKDLEWVINFKDSKHRK